MAKRSETIGLGIVQDNQGRFHCYHCGCSYVSPDHACKAMREALEALNRATVTVGPARVLGLEPNRRPPKRGLLNRLRRILIRRRR